MTTASIVSKVWGFCNPLRDVDAGYGDYLEQLTYLLFLKMADEYSNPPHNRKLAIIILTYLKISSLVTNQRTGTREKKHLMQKRILNVAGGNLPMKKLQPEIRLRLTSPWLKDKSLADPDNLPDPDVIAEDIIENLEAGLESFREILVALNKQTK